LGKGNGVFTEPVNNTVINKEKHGGEVGFLLLHASTAEGFPGVSIIEDMSRPEFLRILP
jgi:hypothetical protein